MAKTLIVYTSKRGTTGQTSRLLADRLTYGADLHDLAHGPVENLDEYDAVIVGGSVYLGKTNKRLRSFIESEEERLLNKRVLALFLCGMEEGEGMQRQLAANFSEQLRKKAVAVQCLGGEFLFSQMGVLARSLMRLALSGDDVHRIDEAAIDALAQAVNSALL